SRSSHSVASQLCLAKPLLVPHRSHLVARQLLPAPKRDRLSLQQIHLTRASENSSLPERTSARRFAAARSAVCGPEGFPAHLRDQAPSPSQPAPQVRVAPGSQLRVESFLP